MSAIDVLPQPFDWTEIPAGKVTLVNDSDDDKNVYLKKGEPRTFLVQAFAIAKYPVTNGQFQVFVDAKDGYANAAWWDYSTDAKAWRKKKPQPKGIAFRGYDHPRANITWYEAIAFCHWLSEQSGEKIMLPTEAQWQRAAQGDDGRIYPWGNDWDCNRCNNSVKPCDSNQTTPVRQYEGNSKGDSFFEVVDMAGNVWEWCLTEYYTGQDGLDGENVRVFRGGPWAGNDSEYFRVDCRHSDYPFNGFDNGGFRIARSLK